MRVLKSLTLSALLLGCGVEVTSQSTSVKQQPKEEKITIVNFSGDVKGLFPLSTYTDNTYYRLQFQLHDWGKNKNYLIGITDWVKELDFKGPLETRGLITRLRAIENDYRAKVDIIAQEKEGFYEPTQFTFEDGTVYTRR